MADEILKENEKTQDVETITKEEYDKIIKKLADVEKERDEANNRIISMTVTDKNEETDTCEFDEIFLKGGNK